MHKLRQSNISKRFPNLLTELDDSQSAVPAYLRFQDQNQNVLRQDLRQIKETYFRKSYDFNLKKHLQDLDNVQFRGAKLDSNKFFDIKYFLTEE